MDTIKINPAHISEFPNGITVQGSPIAGSGIQSNPPAGNNKKITNMYFNEDTGLPEFEVEA